MMTYAEYRGHGKFNWNLWLEARINNEYISNEALRSAAVLAGNWITCACGNQCSVIPRGFHGMPLDIELRQFGQDFSRLIARQNWTNAVFVLKNIERRSAYLIKQYHEKDC